MSRILSQCGNYVHESSQYPHYPSKSSKTQVLASLPARNNKCDLVQSTGCNQVAASSFWFDQGKRESLHGTSPRAATCDCSLFRWLGSNATNCCPGGVDVRPLL